VLRHRRAGASLHLLLAEEEPGEAAQGSVGKKVGIQATGVILLRALLAKNKIPEKDVTIVTIGADMAPLLTGQVDVVTGWLTNTTALKVLGRPARRPAPVGHRRAALRPALLRHRRHAEEQGRRCWPKFLRATGKGWAYAPRPIRPKAVDLLLKEFPNLKSAPTRSRRRSDARTPSRRRRQAEGWGTMDPAVWQNQIDLYAELGQFSKRTPKLDEVMT
jgi:NitT/TauT family transport system substrate-binding protein